MDRGRMAAPEGSFPSGANSKERPPDRRQGLHSLQIIYKGRFYSASGGQGGAAPWTPCFSTASRQYAEIIIKSFWWRERERGPFFQGNSLPNRTCARRVWRCADVLFAPSRGPGRLAMAGSNAAAAAENTRL